MIFDETSAASDDRFVLWSNSRIVYGLHIIHGDPWKSTNRTH